MTAEPDTFSRFLHEVSRCLAEPVPRSAEQAARLHVSRSQLDRVVSAVSGEPPGRLRRRILLERAAYRLVAGDASVLDVAVEAGYSSHEAFTRAFSRAYGAPPATWRRRPRSLRLDAPNGVHFHPPGGLRLPALSKELSMDLVVTMTEHHIWLLREMVERASRLRSDQLDAPVDVSYRVIDESPTLRSLLSRLVGQLDMWNHAVADRPYDFGVEQDESVGSMRERLAECGPTFLGHVRDTCGRGALEETFVDATGESPEFFTYGGMIAHVLSYGAYRRTLVHGGLTAAGVADLEDDPLAWEPVRAPGPTLP